MLKWLITTTRREAWRQLRHAPREAVVPELPEESGAPDEVVDLVAADTDRRLLWRHIARLSERCQHLLRIIAFADQPNYAEIAEALGMPIGSIGPTRGRCLAALRRSLAADPAIDFGGAR